MSPLGLASAQTENIPYPAARRSQRPRTSARDPTRLRAADAARAADGSRPFPVARTQPAHAVAAHKNGTVRALPRSTADPDVPGMPPVERPEPDACATVALQRAEGVSTERCEARHIRL